MSHFAYTQQALKGFNCNTIDEQAEAQAEFYNHLEAQAKEATQTTDPLTSRDRRIIAEIIEVEPESIRTIWIETGITVWVQLSNGGRLPFDRDWFYIRVQEVKATLRETPRERNDRLSEELETACHRYGLTHGEIDWLSFSTTLYFNNRRVGFVGYNRADQWYSRQRPLGQSRTTDSIDAAIALLGISQPVAA
ncbi:hypothetical protein H6G80_26915 [Nostoc sp. FACHB-87]|uniref:hypothetical protein n=1 Tax=Nostocaceae TaxID=1162 RepID=UPI001682B901|nr:MULTISPECIES: hypothetical protein [Nostocaceae]MBD2457690.1 hypothetical protein [Nostoc sp. FACHB-87]MBD2478847.1 hypothetical protein [Anabaena sp. FACHB-83]